MEVGHYLNYTGEVIYGIFIGIAILFSITWRLIRHPIKFFTTFWPKKRDVMPACLNDPSLGSHGFIQLKEVRIHYVSSGDESKPLMLFLHGFPEFWYSWRHQIREFKKDYRVVAVDMRGYVDSDKPKGAAAYKVDTLTEDIKQLIPALGYKSCVLVALDWGSILAYMFTIKNQDMVDKLITMNGPHPATFGDLVKRYKSEVKKFWYVSFFQLPWLPEFMMWMFDYEYIQETYTNMMVHKLSQDDMEAYKYAFSRPGGLTGPINYYRALRRYRPGKFIFSTIETPTLVVWGSQDSILHKEFATLASKFVPNLTVKYIEDSNHFVNIDKPDAVNKIMREWLSS